MARKLAAVTAALFTLVAAPATADALAVRAHSVSADVAIPNGNVMRIDANSAATPQGTLNIFVPGSPLSITGSVVCMSVSGNVAYVVYVDSSFLIRHDGTIGGYVRMLDSSAGDQQNNGRFGTLRLDREMATGCPIPTAGPTFHPLHTVGAGTITIT